MQTATSHPFSLLPVLLVRGTLIAMATRSRVQAAASSAQVQVQVQLPVADAVNLLADHPSLRALARVVSDRDLAAAASDTQRHVGQRINCMIAAASRPTDGTAPPEAWPLLDTDPSILGMTAILGLIHGHPITPGLASRCEHIADLKTDYQLPITSCIDAGLEQVPNDQRTTPHALALRALSDPDTIMDSSYLSLVEQAPDDHLVLVERTWPGACAVAAAKWLNPERALGGPRRAAHPASRLTDASVQILLKRGVHPSIPSLDRTEIGQAASAYVCARLRDPDGPQTFPLDDLIGLGETGGSPYIDSSAMVAAHGQQSVLTRLSSLASPQKVHTGNAMRAAQIIVAAWIQVAADSLDPARMQAMDAICMASHLNGRKVSPSDTCLLHGMRDLLRLACGQPQDTPGVPWLSGHVPHELQPLYARHLRLPTRILAHQRDPAAADAAIRRLAMVYHMADARSGMPNPCTLTPYIQGRADHNDSVGMIGHAILMRQSTMDPQDVGWYLQRGMPWSQKPLEIAAGASAGYVEMRPIWSHMLLQHAPPMATDAKKLIDAWLSRSPWGDTNTLGQPIPGFQADMQQLVRGMPAPMRNGIAACALRCVLDDTISADDRTVAEQWVALATTGS